MKNILVATLMALLMVGPASAQQAAANLNAQDQRFLKEIGQSTLAEVALGNLAAQKATTPALRLFGRWMASTDGLANRQLATMMEAMHAPALPGRVTAEQQAEFKEMNSLTGAAFDWQYLKMTVPGHQKEIALFQQEAQAGQDPTVRAFARNMVLTAQEHLAAVQDLLKTMENPQK